MGTLYHSNWSLESSRINRAPPFFIIYVNWRIWIHYEEFLQKIYTIICNNESKTQWSWGCSVFDAIIDHVTGMFSCHNTTLIIPQGYMEKGHRKYSIPLGVKKIFLHMFVTLQIKCYQYWPCGEAYAHYNQLEFGNFKINYLRELHNEYFTTRSLELENILVSSLSYLHCFLFWLLLIKQAWVKTGCHYYLFRQERNVQ